MSRVQRGIFRIPHPDASGFGMTIVTIATQSLRGNDKILVLRSSAQVSLCKEALDALH